MSEKPDLEGIRKSLDFPRSRETRLISGYWRQKLLDVIDYATALEQKLAELSQEHADYAEHTAASHRVMVDEVDRLERVATAARKLTVGRLAYVAAWDAESVTDSGNYLADWKALCSALALLATAP